MNSFCTWRYAIIFFLVTALSFKTFGFEKDTFNYPVKGVEVCYYGLFDKSYEFYTAGPYTLYHSYYIYRSTVYSSSEDEDVPELFEHNSPGTEKRSTFLVYHKDSSYGFHFDPRRPEKNSRVAVDSAIQRISGKYDKDAIFSRKPDSVFLDSKEGILKEIYYFKARKDTPAIRQIFNYSKLFNHLDYSLIPELDSARGMKLYRTELMIEGYFSETHQQQVPKIRLDIEMSSIPMPDTKLVYSYINAYREKIL